MSTYAQIVNGVVVNVIVADDKFILESNLDYVLLTRGGIGYTYNKEANQFIAPQPFESWKLNSFYEWEAPKPYPSDRSRYYWNEDLQEWIKENER